jgi:hypothetical protein
MNNDVTCPYIVLECLDKANE